MHLLNAHETASVRLSHGAQSARAAPAVNSTGGKAARRQHSRLKPLATSTGGSSRTWAKLFSLPIMTFSRLPSSGLALIGCGAACLAASLRLGK